MEWIVKRVNNIESNPIDCYWAVAPVGQTFRLYKIIEQYPTDTDGLVYGKEPELYILFEALDAQKVSENQAYADVYGPWKAPRGFGFVHAYKTMDDAKARAITQVKAIQGLIDRYFEGL